MRKPEIYSSLSPKDLAKKIKTPFKIIEIEKSFKIPQKKLRTLANFLIEKRKSEKIIYEKIQKGEIFKNSIKI